MFRPISPHHLPSVCRHIKSQDPAVKHFVPILRGRSTSNNCDRIFAARVACEPRRHEWKRSQSGFLLDLIFSRMFIITKNGFFSVHTSRHSVRFVCERATQLVMLPNRHCFLSFTSGILHDTCTLLAPNTMVFGVRSLMLLENVAFSQVAWMVMQKDWIDCIFSEFDTILVRNLSHSRLNNGKVIRLLYGLADRGKTK